MADGCIVYLQIVMTDEVFLLQHLKVKPFET